MKMPLSWRWPRGAALSYCVKVATATLLGYLLSLGGVEHAVYGAFSAALIVGASRGEDVSSSANRVRGSLAGVVAGIAMSYLQLPPALAVAVGIGATAYLCMGCGWGVAAARIGASLCAVTVLMHSQDAVGYIELRVTNTLIGIAAGLAVSYLVLPVRGRDAVAQASNAALVALGNLLNALAHSDEPPSSDLHGAVFDRLLELQKAMRDARNEFGAGDDAEALWQNVRQVALACAGALTASIAQAELRTSPAALAAAQDLRQEAARLAERALGHGAPASNGLPRGRAAADDSAAATAGAREGLALGLRKIASALDALGR